MLRAALPERRRCEDGHPAYRVEMDPWTAGTTGTTGMYYALFVLYSEPQQVFPACDKGHWHVTSYADNHERNIVTCFVGWDVDSPFI